MSDATDFEGATTTITDAALKAAGVAAAVTATVPLVGAVAVAFTALLTMLGQTDEIHEAVKQLDGHFDAILSAGNQVVQMRDVANLVNAARAQLDPIRALSPGQSLSESQRAVMDSKTDEVVRTLGDLAFWKRPFFSEVVYSDNWSGSLPPDPSLGPGSLVFEYRLTLPAYLESIAIRLIVLLALEGGIKATRQGEIAQIANQLEEKYNTIVAGIVTIRPPGFLDVELPNTWMRGTPNSDLPGSPSAIDIYGAVERYSTFATVDHWDMRQLPLPGPGFDTGFLEFSAKHALGSLARWKKVYVAVGLADVWRILVHLKALAGRPVPPSVDLRSAWSLREVDHVLATQILNRPSTGSPNVPISARNLMRMIGSSPPSGLKVAFGSF
jgi:hypothetical protein